MNIPETIKIGGHILPVRFSEDIGNMGEWNHAKQTIKLYKDTCVSQQEETLLHEIIECINYTYELKLPHAKIQILGATLHQIVRDNPQLFQKEMIKNKE
jgi:hypothetical protein